MLYALFAAGFFSVMLVFGEDELPLGEWTEVRLCLAAIAAACFYTLHRLTVKWERGGKTRRTGHD